MISKIKKKKKIARNKKQLISQMNAIKLEKKMKIMKKKKK